MMLKKFDIDEYIAQEEELNSAIKIEDNHIVIRIPDNDFNEVYDIPLSDLVDAAGIVEWIFHLAEKQWINRHMLRRFIKIASAHAGIKL